MSSTVTARPSTPGPIIDQTTILSLLAALTALVVAYVLSHRLLHPQSSKTIRVLFIWHFFDALIHFLFEGSFLYHCFFTFAPSLSPNVVNPPLTAPGVSFLGRKDRVYGSFYSQSPTAKLWQEYAKADRRWGGADLGVISLELLTVFGAGPIASYVCWLLVNGAGGIGKDASGKKDAKLWFWATVLATGELYGGKSPLQFLLPLLFNCANSIPRLHDIRPRMANRLPEPGHQQLHVHVGISVLLQHALGLVTPVDPVSSVPQRPKGLCHVIRHRQWDRGEEEEGWLSE